MTNKSAICPTCGRDDFSSARGMKHHHAVAHGESIARVMIECNYCGDNFRVPSTEQDIRIHCSRECQGKALSDKPKEEQHAWKGGKQTCYCDHCGESYEITPALADESRFCSRECSDTFFDSKWERNKSEIECKECGDTYEVAPHREEKSVYCSQECAGTAKKGAKNPNWKEENEKASLFLDMNREDILERDNWECQLCGLNNRGQQFIYESNLSVHHLYPRRLFHEDIDDEYVTMAKRGLFEELPTDIQSLLQDRNRAANHPTNLVAVCSVCHGNFEQLPTQEQVERLSQPLPDVTPPCYDESA